MADRVGEVRMGCSTSPTPATRTPGGGSPPRGSGSARTTRTQPEVTARRILNWIYAGQRFGGAGDVFAQPRAAGRARPREPRARPQPPHARALRAADRRPRFPRSSTRSTSPLAELDRNLATDFHPDGVHREASTHYHAIALRSFVGARENAARLRARAAARLRRRRRARPGLPRPLHAPRRDDPRAVRRRHRRLLGAAARRATVQNGTSRSATAATTSSAAAGTATRAS